MNDDINGNIAGDYRLDNSKTATSKSQKYKIH